MPQYDVKGFVVKNYDKITVEADSPEEAEEKYFNMILGGDGELLTIRTGATTTLKD